MNWEHLHLPVNHFPILGILLGLGLFVFALWQMSEACKRALPGSVAAAEGDSEHGSR